MDLEMYIKSRSAYQRAKASGNWEAANKAILEAIEACPVDEALPTLAAWREEAAERVKPVSRVAKALGLGVRV